MSATRRTIANAAIGVGAENAYYAARELREALERVVRGFEGGERKLTAILANDCDDYQRALHHCLSSHCPDGGVADLKWLEGILEVRGRVAQAARTTRMRALPLASPYATKASGGPVQRLD